MHRVVVDAPAKINLYLDITGTAPNGYHLLNTVMQTVSLNDIVVLGCRPEKGVRVTCSQPDIPEGEGNLAYHAAMLLLGQQAALQEGLHIHIDKQVPSQAGLGGGSANAAAVLVGLNHLLGAPYTLEQLCALSLQLGSDIPFLLRGGCALAQGVGEQLTSLFPGLHPCTLVIAKPFEGVSTAYAYAEYDNRETIRHGDVERIQLALAVGDLARTGAELFNVFEQVCPGKTEAIREVMLRCGAAGAVLSGSGSAVVGLFAEPAAADYCMRELCSCVEEAFIAYPVGYGARILHES